MLKPGTKVRVKADAQFELPAYRGKEGVVAPPRPMQYDYYVRVDLSQYPECVQRSWKQDGVIALHPDSVEVIE